MMDHAELIHAIEENAAQLLLRMGTTGGGDLRDDGRARWTIGGSPIDYHNAVVDVAEEAVDEVIAESLDKLAQYGVPGSWHVGPSMPPGVGERLVAAGFSSGGSEPGMAVDLEHLNDAPLGPPGLRITRVTTDDELSTWQRTLARGFGEGEREARWVAGIYRQEGLADPWRHYLGYLDGRPVATVTIFLAAGVAGVYFVMTVPEARRQGIGAAITRYAVRAAAGDVGYAVLGSSSAGRSVYASLGFREYCVIDLYEISSSTGAQPGSRGPSQGRRP